MSVISANISFKRGGHELLDFSSIHQNYIEALKWAQDKNSNAAVGQFIYLREPITVSTEGPEVKSTTYAKGGYIVEAIGSGAILTPLSKSVAGGDIDVSLEVTDLKSGLATALNDISDLKAKDVEINSALADKATKSELEPLAKTETVNAALALKADKTEIKNYELVAGKNEGNTYASQYEFKVNGEVVTTINIAKDQFLKEAKFIAKATEEDQSAGAVLGDPYLKFTWLLDDNVTNPTYVPVKELVKTYTADNKYITIAPDNIITFNLDQLKTDLNSVYAAKSIEDKVDVDKVSTAIEAAKQDAITDAEKYAAIEVNPSDWSTDKLDNETKAIQAKALKAKFGEMSKYVNETFGIEKVSSLPSENQSTNKVYLLDKDSNGQCVENIWLGDKWYVLGSTTYFTKEEINTALNLKADKTYVDDNFLKKTDSLTKSDIEIITGIKVSTESEKIV